MHKDDQLTGTRGNSNSVRDVRVYFLFQRSVIDLFVKRVYFGQIPGIKLCNKLTFIIFSTLSYVLFTVESMRASILYCTLESYFLANIL